MSVERALRPLGGLVPSLIAANVILAAATAFAQMALTGARGIDGFLDGAVGPDPRVLALLGAEIHERVLRGQVWSVLSCAFLHGGLLHIGVNMLSLRSFGGAMEEIYGAGKALALYLLSGVAGVATSLAWFQVTGPYVVDGREILVPRMGASCCISGWAGLIAAVGFRIGGEGGRALWRPMFQSMGLFLVLGLVLAFSGSRILFDIPAHLGAFAFGMAAGWTCTFGARAREDAAAAKAWDGAAVVLAALTVLSFVPPALMLVEALGRR